MILRLSDSLSRGLLVIGSLLVALWVSFFGVRAGIAGLAAESESINELRWAVRLEPKNPEFWYRLGHYQQFNLEQPDVMASGVSYAKTIPPNPGYAQARFDFRSAH